MFLAVFTVFCIMTMAAPQALEPVPRVATAKKSGPVDTFMLGLWQETCRDLTS